MEDIIFRNLEGSADSINVSEKNILRSLQVPPGMEDEYLTDQIKLYIGKSIGICEPAASYTICDKVNFNPEAGSSVIGGVHFSTGKIVTSALRRSEYVALFVCTCGDKVEKLSKQLLLEGHFLEGYIVDLVGSEIAESLAEIVHRNIGEDMKKNGLHYTNRYSPGYCSWPVSDQQHLFPLLKNTCGVTLTESSLMLPIKSVSGIVGIGPDVKFQGYTCSKCDAAFCIYRDKR